MHSVTEALEREGIRLLAEQNERAAAFAAYSARVAAGEPVTVLPAGTAHFDVAMEGE